MNFTLGNFICLPIKMTDKWIGDFISTPWALQLGLTKIQRTSKNLPEFSTLNGHNSYTQFLWCHRYHKNMWCPHTQVWTVSVTVTWTTTTPGWGDPANGPMGGRGVVTSFLNCMAGRHLLWLLQHSPLPVSLCPLWQEPGQKSLSMLWTDTMPMGARPMAREKGLQYWYMLWAQRCFALDTGGSTKMEAKAGTPTSSAIGSNSGLHSACAAPLPHSISLGTFHFLLNERQALHVLACGSVTHSHKCDLN